MKKLLAVFLAVAMIACFGTAWAFDGSGFGYINPKAEGNLAIDGDVEFIPWGFSAGGGIAGGTDIEITASGFIRNGRLILEGDVATGGYVESYDFSKVAAPGSNNPLTKVSLVGTGQFGTAVNSQDIHIGVYYLDGEKHAHRINGNAFADVTNRGMAGQATGGVSLIELPFFFQTEGHAGALVAQGAVGSWEIRRGWGPDLSVGANNFWKLTGHYAGAGMGVGIETSGQTENYAGRFLNTEGGQRREGTFAYGYSGTTINTYAYNYDYEGPGWGDNADDAHAHGDWKASGVVLLGAEQSYQGADVSATAKGFYADSGRLNDGFSGSAEGYVETSVQTFGGGSGSLRSASAEMTVITNNLGGGQPQMDN